mgnify:CR=1 FL=1
MSITRTAVSYYNLGYVEHAEADFREMLDHGCTTVILAVTEFDFDFWRPNIPRIVEAAHRLGLQVLIDPWGIGKFFGGEHESDCQLLSLANALLLQDPLLQPKTVCMHCNAVLSVFHQAPKLLYD